MKNSQFVRTLRYVFTTDAQCLSSTLILCLLKTHVISLIRKWGPGSPCPLCPTLLVVQGENNQHISVIVIRENGNSLFRKNTYFTPHYQVDFWREVSFSEAGGKRWKMEGLLPYTKYKFRPICQFSPSFNPIKAFPSSDVVTTLPGGIPSPPHISSVLQVRDLKDNFKEIIITQIAEGIGDCSVYFTLFNLIVVYSTSA